MSHTRNQKWRQIKVFKFLGLHDQELFQIIIALFFSTQFSRRKIFYSFFLNNPEHSRQEKRALWPLHTPSPGAPLSEEDASQCVLSPGCKEETVGALEAQAPRLLAVSLEQAVDAALFQLQYLRLIARGPDGKGNRREPSVHVRLLVFSVLGSCRWAVTFHGESLCKVSISPFSNLV